MTRLLIFDFDGLILDTETPEFQVWQEIYREHGCALDAGTWGQIVGGAGHSDFDPVTHLEALTSRFLDRRLLREAYRNRSDARIALQPVLPGVMDYINEAKRLGLRLAIASSSPHRWVDGHLQRLGLMDYFDVILCADDVPEGRTKPHPDLFLKVLESVNISAEEAIVLEDSPNGLSAGKAAGIFTVAVPNPFTAQLDLTSADLRLASLTALPLQDLLRKVAELS